MTSGHSRSRSSAVASLARIDCLGPPLNVTWTSGFARTLCTQAGVVSSPPRDPTTTIVSPSWCGEVSITVRGWPLLRPVVVSSSTGMLPARHPMRPPLSLSVARWKALSVWKTKSLGTTSTLTADDLSGPPVDGDEGAVGEELGGDLGADDS